MKWQTVWGRLRSYLGLSSCSGNGGAHGKHHLLDPLSYKSTPILTYRDIFAYPGPFTFRIA